MVMQWKGPVQERDHNASGERDHGKALAFKNTKPAVEYNDQETAGGHCTKPASQPILVWEKVELANTRASAEAHTCNVHLGSRLAPFT